MSKYEHVCIKPACGKKYESEDEEPYYCSECEEAKKKIAEEVDKQMASRPPRRKLSSFEEQTGQMKTVKGITFINLPK